MGLNFNGVQMKNAFPIFPVFEMSNFECFGLCAEFEKTGGNSEDWDALISWIEKTKGEKARINFEKRCEYPM
jgi:hypothetical protein